MKKKVLGRTLSVMLCAAMLFTSVPVNAENVGEGKATVIDVAETGNETKEGDLETLSDNEVEDIENVTTEEGEEVVETSEDGTWVADDDDILFSLDWKNATDEEITTAVTSVSAETTGVWLKEMSEEEYAQLLNRETRLSEETNVLSMDGETGEVTEVKTYDTYAEYALESAPKNMKAGEFTNTTLAFYIETVKGGVTKTQTVTMTLENKNTAKQDFKVATSGPSWIDFDYRKWTSRRTSAYGGSATAYIYTHPKLSFAIPKGYSVSITADNCNTNKRGKTVYEASTYNATADGITGTVFKQSDYVAVDTACNLATCIDLLYNAGGKNKSGTNSKTSGSNIVYKLTLNPANYTVNYVSNSQNVGSSVWTYGQNHNMLAAPVAPSVQATFNEGGGISNASLQFHKWNIGGAQYDANQSVGDLTTVNNAALTATAEFAPATITMAGTPSKTGYTFTGWKCDQDGVTRGAGDTMQTYGNVSFQAQWSPHSYSVVLDSNGGSAVNNVDAVYGQAVALPTPTRVGYTFLGWGGSLLKTAYNLTPVNNASVALAAQWSANDTQYTINRYIQKAVGSKEYELYKAPEGAANPVAGTEVKSAPTDTLITEPAMEIDGYITPTSIGPKAISGDGSTTFDFYYDVPSLTVNHYYRNTLNGEWILYNGTMHDYTDPEYTRTTAAKRGENVTPAQLSAEVLTAFESAHRGYYLEATEGLKTVVIDKATEVNYYYDMKERNVPVNYTVEHYIQKSIGGEYEKYSTSTSQAEPGSVISAPLDDKAIETVNAIEGCACEKPQLQTVTVTENMVIKYYYACVSKEQVQVQVQTQESGGLDANSIEEIIKKMAAGLSFKMDINGVNYEIIQNPDGTFGIKFTNSTDVVIHIPDTITIGDKVYRVTEIHENAFKDNTTVREVILGQNISSIGTSAFEGCTALEKVTLNTGLVTIGDKAFKDCNNLKSITMPSTLQVIGAEAFMNCTKLKTLILNEGLLKINGKAFYNCKALTKVKIPKSVLKIHKYAFAKCTSLKSFTFAAESKLLAMNEGVLYGCSSLKKIKLPSMLKGISSKTFKGCKKLTSVTGGERVTRIGKSAFENCYKLTKFTVKSKVQNIGAKAFYNCKALKKVTIESNALTGVGSKAFKKCKKGIVISVPSGKAASYTTLLKGKY